jgi:choline-glycine betaine transporter
MGATAVFQKSIDAAENPLALSSDFHSGPLSVVLSFGIWGVLVWLWYWAAGFFVVWRNYHYGDPALRHINLFLYAGFLAKCISFLFIFGGVVDDVGGFGAIIGLSIALNHGVMRRPKFAVHAVPAPQPAPAAGRTPFPVRPTFPALGR